ncbi:MAG: chitobiase/beta-hexosaminidase C-terminal domain-containing protein, partial [Spirochaetota bacterium]
MTTSRRLLVMPLALALSILLLGACSEDRPRRRGRAEGVVVIDFDDYRGSEVSLPDNVFVSGEDGSDVPVTGDFYPFTGVSSLEREDDFDGFGAFTADGDDYSFGIREHGAADLRDSRLFVRYENRTNRTVYGFKLSYDVETWLNGDRDNRIRLKYNTRRDGFGSIDDIVSTANPLTAAPGDDRPGRPVDGSLHENRTTVEVAFHFSELRGMAEGGLDRFGTLEPGETGYLRWQYSNHHLTEGSVRSALALNNIIVEPILTPPRDADRGASEPLGAIALSRSAGFYDEPFDLELSTSLPEARIYYTVDGSRPDPDAVMSDTQWADLPIETRRRTFEYRRPIDLAALEQRENDVATIPTSVRDSDPVWIPPETRLPKAATVRAVAIGAQSRSAVRTATFLFAPSGETHHELPVWSIQTDRGSFFDPDSGIYVPGPDAPEVNYFRRGSDWEAEAHIEFFEDDRRRVLAQQMGIRIHGNYTRTYPQKSLRLYSRT